MKHKVNLTNFGGRKHFCFEATTFHPKFCCITGCGNNRTFFDGHWNDMHFIIDQKVWCHPKREIKISNRIFYKVIMYFLAFSICVPIRLNHVPCFFGVFKMLVYQPLNFSFFRKLREPFY